MKEPGRPITILMADVVSRANDVLGGMWTVVATIFVFRNAGAGGRADGPALDPRRQGPGLRRLDGTRSRRTHRAAVGA